MSFMKAFVKCLGVSALAVGTTASAGTVSYNSSFGPQAIGFPTQTLVSLPLFDPSLGVLKEVTLKMKTTTFAGTLNWDNETSVPTNVKLSIGAKVQATANGLNLTTHVSPSAATGTGIGIDDDGTADFAGLDSFSVRGNTEEDEDVVTLADLLDAFIGVGLFDVIGSSDVDANIETNGGSGPSDAIGGATTGDIEVVYTYDPIDGGGTGTDPDPDPNPEPVPEPASMILWSLGGLGMLVVTRRRKKARQGL